jgi:hypothetical protein
MCGVGGGANRARGVSCVCCRCWLWHAQGPAHPAPARQNPQQDTQRQELEHEELHPGPCVVPMLATHHSKVHPESETNTARALARAVLGPCHAQHPLQRYSAACWLCTPTISPHELRPAQNEPMTRTHAAAPLVIVPPCGLHGSLARLLLLLLILPHLAQLLLSVVVSELHGSRSKTTVVSAHYGMQGGAGCSRPAGAPLSSCLPS